MHLEIKTCKLKQYWDGFQGFNSFHFLQCSLRLEEVGTDVPPLKYRPAAASPEAMRHADERHSEQYVCPSTCISRLSNNLLIMRNGQDLSVRH